jgi:hypothetical protein
MAERSLNPSGLGTGPLLREGVLKGSLVAGQQTLKLKFRLNSDNAALPSTLPGGGLDRLRRLGACVAKLDEQGVRSL